MEIANLVRVHASTLSREVRDKLGCKEIVSSANYPLFHLDLSSYQIQTAHSRQAFITGWPVAISSSGVQNRSAAVRNPLTPVGGAMIECTSTCSMQICSKDPVWNGIKICKLDCLCQRKGFYL